MLATASLELKAEKQSAHSGRVMSVAFSPDGSTIVSGSEDQTIKVWDVVNFRAHVGRHGRLFAHIMVFRAWWRNI